MIIGGTACLLHAVFPFIFKNTGSNYLLRMTNDFIGRLPRLDERVAKLAETLDQKRCQQAEAAAAAAIRQASCDKHAAH